MGHPVKRTKPHTQRPSLSFRKARAVTPDTPAQRAEKDRLITEWLARHRVKRLLAVCVSVPVQR